MAEEDNLQPLQQQQIDDVVFQNRLSFGRWTKECKCFFVWNIGIGVFRFPNCNFELMFGGFRT